MRDVEHQREFSNTDTTYVLEMEGWDKTLWNPAYQHDKRAIFETLQHIIIEKKYHDSEDGGWITEPFADSKFIVLRIENDGGHTFFYLFGLTEHRNIESLKHEYPELSHETLLKQAHRGFPDWILYSEFEEWIALEEDDQANLALSDEEIDVLNHSVYPFFINGLAGSGKSTILYYLFAHTFAYHITRSTELLFLSYSRSLVEKARMSVTALLETNPVYHRYREGGLDREEKNNLNQCFCPFQEFIRSNFLHTEEELERFSPDKHIGYTEFKEKYELCMLPEAKIYSAAIVWSVIRTFIKGRNYARDSYYSVEEYKQLKQKDQTIEEKDYEIIYSIWKNWYSAKYEKTEAGWDDIDLVRYVLRKMDSDDSHKRFDVIFCDEAQDFTPIENLLILKLSKYTQYNLESFDRIPIAYAGDPNQTVSPTGFTWSRLKTVFSQSFERGAGKCLELHQCPLNNNYRSKHTIVEFANTLQYIRKHFLTEEEALRPQDQWNPQHNPIPGFIFLDSNADKELVKECFDSALSIIMGGDDSAETLNKKSLQDDDLLASLNNQDKVYTAISVKGHEFDSVVLYNFADYLPSCFAKILDETPIVNESEHYELAHFFTKLYIAVTRAKDVLYIVDSRNNYENFWKHFVNNELANRLMAKRDDHSIWEKKVGGIEVVQDIIEVLQRLKKNFNPLEVARRMFRDAELNEDAVSMNKAAGYYEEAKCFKEANIARAYALCYEKKYKEAGEQFVNLHEIERARDVFWAGSCWNEIYQYGEGAQRLASGLMLNKISLADFIGRRSIIEDISCTDYSWKLVAMQIGKLALKADKEILRSLCDFMEQLSEAGFTFLDDGIADLCLKSGRYGKAVEKWDKLNKTNHQKYYLAKEHLSESTSELIYWMDKGGKSTEIFKKYSSPNDIRIYNLDDTARRIIFNLLLKSTTFKQAMDYPVGIEEDQKLQLLNRADRVLFIMNYVLKDFDDNKYTRWVDEPLRLYGDTTFEKSISKEFFDAVIALPKRENWINFFKQRDQLGNQIMKNEANISTIIDSLCTYLTTHSSMEHATCLLDMLFNQAGYNYANANKYFDFLKKIFSDYNFMRDDFRLSSQRNAYFRICESSASDVDIIKSRLRSFAKTKLDSYRSIKSDNVNEVKVLCHIYEKAGNYIHVQDKENSHFSYDLDDVLAFYGNLKHRKKFSEELLKFFDCRRLVLQTQNLQQNVINEFNKGLNGSLLAKDVVATFDEADAIWFIKNTLGRLNFQSEEVIPHFSLIASLFYDFNLHLNDFYEDEKKAIRKNTFPLIDSTLEEIMDESRIDIHRIKLVTYLWEILCSDPTDTATRYDKLAVNPRFRKLPFLVDYFHTRALYHYSFAPNRVFDDHLRKYELPYSMSSIRELQRPTITVDENKVNAQGQSKTKVSLIETDTILGEYEILLKQKMKTIWFTCNGDELISVKKGIIIDHVDSIEISGSSFSLADNFKVCILSEDRCTISYDEHYYEIRF